MRAAEFFKDLWDDGNLFQKASYVISIPLLLLVVFSLIHAIFFVDHSQGSVRDRPSRNTTEDHYWAEVACEDSVSNQLKAPSTADYDVTVSNELRDGVWFVSGTVDAENAFGAKVRHHWTCNAERSSSDSWTAVATVN